MTEHTKGKAKYDQDLGILWIGENTAISLLDTEEGFEGDTPWLHANALRLVACWNFCHDLTTEELESFVVREEKLATEGRQPCKTT